jgi:hypothetical protein
MPDMGTKAHQQIPAAPQEGPAEASPLAPLLDIKATGFAGWLDRMLGRSDASRTFGDPVFTVLSGLGFGFLAFLGWGARCPAGWAAFFLWGLGYGLAVAGLLASTFHLGNPQNAAKAFSSGGPAGLSREAWAAVATLLLLAPVALSDWLGLGCRAPSAGSAAAWRWSPSSPPR